MDKPFFVPIEPSQGWSEALVLIRGYISEDSFTIKMEENWRRAVRESGWKGSIYLGYSLGVRVIYYAMEAWSEYSHLLNNAILLGGAVRRDSSKEWGKVASKLAGRIVNVYNSKDRTLEREFKIGELYMKSPCGLKPIKEFHAKITNVDATSLIATSDHSELHYLRVLQETVGRRLWLYK